VTALHHGAKAIIPVSEIAEALEIQRSEVRGQRSEAILLGGERDGVRISADGVDFDLGNSPREYTPEKVRGKTIVSTTTNGTRALRACVNAKEVLAGSFLNLAATVARVKKLSPENLILVGSGTGEAEAFEDTLAVGALIASLEPDRLGLSPDAVRAVNIWREHEADLAGAMRFSSNGQRLLAMPDLAADVAFCLRRDVYDLAAVMGRDGAVLKMA
jgi:2-phosphosulfolactate phosphatase